MAAAPAISLDRFRRARTADAQGEPTAALSPAPRHDTHPLVGASLGLVDRRYGLMSSEQHVRVVEVLSASGDLAVADRLAFIAAMERHVTFAVVSFEGWYLVCATDIPLDVAALAQLRGGDIAEARLMSLASERGITPALGPLACA
jgi:hypothetical protein